GTGAVISAAGLAVGRTARRPGPGNARGDARVAAGIAQAHRSHHAARHARRKRGAAAGGSVAGAARWADCRGGVLSRKRRGEVPMRITVQYMAQLRRAAGTAEEVVEVAGDCTVAELLLRLAESRGETFRDMVVDAQGKLQPSLLLFVEEEQV